VWRDFASVLAFSRRWGGYRFCATLRLRWGIAGFGAGSRPFGRKPTRLRATAAASMTGGELMQPVAAPGSAREGRPAVAPAVTSGFAFAAGRRYPRRLIVASLEKRFSSVYRLCPGGSSSFPWFSA